LADAIDERIWKIRSLWDIDMDDVRKAAKILWEKDLVKWVEKNIEDNPWRNVKDALYEVVRFIPWENWQRKYWLEDIQNLNKKLWVNAFTTKDLRAADSMSAKDVYRDLSRMLWGDKEASNFLNDIWYDGIHYFGGQDWEAYVIFRDDSLNITNHEKWQKYWTAGKWEKGISAAEWLNIRNFKNWKTVQELANQYWIDTKIVDSISTPEWQRAYWMYWDRLITLSKDLKESTVPHELLHGVFDIVDNTRKTEILDWIKKRLNVDDIQAEEWLADNFSEYYRTGKFWTKWLAKWLVEKVKQFFYEVKSYIDGTYKNEKQIRQLFDDIIDWKIEWEYWVYSDPKFQSVWHGSPNSLVSLTVLICENENEIKLMDGDIM
jgi:hypothetical protein